MNHQLFHKCVQTRLLHATKASTRIFSCMCVAIAGALSGSAAAETILDASVPRQSDQLGYLFRAANPTLGYSVSGLGDGRTALAGAPYFEWGLYVEWAPALPDVISFGGAFPQQGEFGKAVGSSGVLPDGSPPVAVVGYPGFEALDDCPLGASAGAVRHRRIGLIRGSGCGRVGDAVSGIGDVNGDGVGDVVFAAPLEDRAYVLSGAARLGDVDVPFNDPAIGFNIIGIPASASPGSMDVAGVGDIDGDGVSDFAIAVRATPVALAGGQRAFGAVYVFRGRDTAWPIDANVNPAVRLFDSSNVVDAFANRVAGVGDMNGDGRGDIAITSQFGAELIIVLGSPALGSMDLADNPPGVVRIVLPPALAGARIRDVSGVGDVDGDGFADLIFGAYVPPPLNRGVVCIVPGRQDLLSTPLYDMSASDKVTCVRGPLSHGDSVGTAGDVNGDGRPEWLAGIPLYDVEESIGAVMGFDSRRVADLANWGPLAAQATYRRFVSPSICTGGNPASAVGALGDQQDAATPSSRFWLDLCRGDSLSPRPVAGRVAVTLHRARPAPLNLDVDRFARVYWRAEWQLSEQARIPVAEVALKYTNAEIAALAEGTLQVYRLDILNGGWVPADLSRIDARANIAYATVPTSTSQFLALVGAQSIEADLSVELREIAPSATYRVGDQVQLQWEFKNQSDDRASMAEMLAETNLTLVNAAGWTCTGSSVELCPDQGSPIYQRDENFSLSRSLLPGQSVVLQLAARVPQGVASISAVGTVNPGPNAPADNERSNNIAGLDLPIIPGGAQAPVFTDGFEGQ